METRQHDDSLNVETERFCEEKQCIMEEFFLGVGWRDENAMEKIVISFTHSHLEVHEHFSNEL